MQPHRDVHAGRAFVARQSRYRVPRDGRRRAYCSRDCAAPLPAVHSLSGACQPVTRSGERSPLPALPRGLRVVRATRRKRVPERCQAGAAQSSNLLIYLAVPRGLEPPTFGLGNRRSIRLSYGTESPLIAERKPVRQPPAVRSAAGLSRQDRARHAAAAVTAARCHSPGASGVAHTDRARVPFPRQQQADRARGGHTASNCRPSRQPIRRVCPCCTPFHNQDRKSTRLNSSH